MTGQDGVWNRNPASKSHEYVSHPRIKDPNLLGTFNFGPGEISGYTNSIHNNTENQTNKEFMKSSLTVPARRAPPISAWNTKSSTGPMLRKLRHHPTPFHAGPRAIAAKRRYNASGHGLPCGRCPTRQLARLPKQKKDGLTEAGQQQASRLSSHVCKSDITCAGVDSHSECHGLGD